MTLCATTDTSYLKNKKELKKTGTSWAHLSSHFPFVIPSQASAAAAKQEALQKSWGNRERYGVGVFLFP